MQRSPGIFNGRRYVPRRLPQQLGIRLRTSLYRLTDPVICDYGRRTERQITC
jgi:hypothetical protein